MVDTVSAISHALNLDFLRLESVGHNLANVHSPAFKKQFVVQSGVGVSSLPVFDVVRDLSVGVLRQSNDVFDVAIEGEGFFVAEGADGTVFSRLGRFALDELGQFVLVSGEVVQGVQGPILLPSSDFVVDSDGSVRVDDVLFGQLSVVEFEDVSRLQAVGDGRFVVADGGFVQAVEVGQVRVRQGFVEAANVDSVREFTDLLELSRHFELVQKVRGVYDEMLGGAIASIGRL